MFLVRVGKIKYVVFVSASALAKHSIILRRVGISRKYISKLVILKFILIVLLIYLLRMILLQNFAAWRSGGLRVPSVND